MATFHNFDDGLNFSKIIAEKRPYRLYCTLIGISLIMKIFPLDISCENWNIQSKLISYIKLLRRLLNIRKVVY